MVRVAVNCYTSLRHYKKWVPLQTLMDQITEGLVGGRNIDVDPEHDMADVVLHLGGRLLIRWESDDARIGAAEIEDHSDPSPESLAEMPEVDNRGARRGHYAYQAGTTEATDATL
jgi:hypothetical protein